MWEEMERYRRVVTLESGERILLRPLNRGDAQGLLELFRRASDQDVAYFRNNVRDETLVSSWAENLDLQRVFPVVAVSGERIVGDATLHIGKGVTRHLAWVRIYLDREFRRKGIGTELVKTLIEIARRIGLQQVVAEIVSSQVQAIKAFESLGFQHEYTHTDFYLFRENEAFDLVVYVRRLSSPPGRC
jgi:RimJ/RimL family protein N-acetyltransferase